MASFAMSLQECDKTGTVVTNGLFSYLVEGVTKTPPPSYREYQVAFYQNVNAGWKAQHIGSPNGQIEIILTYVKRTTEVNLRNIYVACKNDDKYFLFVDNRGKKSVVQVVKFDPSGSDNDNRLKELKITMFVDTLL